MGTALYLRVENFLIRGGQRCGTQKGGVMHKYLRTIGFSQYHSEAEVRMLLNQLQERFIKSAGTVRLGSGDMLWEIRAELGPGLGISMSGYADPAGELIRENYMPYFESREISSDVFCSIQRHIDREVYSGLLDDIRVGISLIFRLSNAGEYLYRKQKLLSTNPRGIRLTGFCTSGKILLPLQKNARQRAVAKTADRVREQMIEAARNGDETAMENLTAEDMNTYAMISRRMMKEDIYSIVDSCFMPEGIECDIYSVIGDILKIESRKNLLTGEEIWDFLIQTNDLPVHICINQIDLQGEPAVGRRFKGMIWMQGAAVWEN